MTFVSNESLSLSAGAGCVHGRVLPEREHYVVMTFVRNESCFPQWWHWMRTWQSFMGALTLCCHDIC